MRPLFLQKTLLSVLFTAPLIIGSSSFASSLDLKTHPDFVQQPQGSSPEQRVVTPRTPARQIRPQLPGGIAPTKNNTPAIITLNVTASFTTHETSAGWRWNIMLQNISPSPIAANNYELKVFQILDLPNQTSPAGPNFPLPALGTGQKQGFSSNWTRNPKARKLRMEIWDIRRKVLAMHKILPLASLGQVARPTVNAAIANNKNLFDRPRLIITGGTYLGRGAWRADVKSSNMPIDANRYTYSYIYRFSSGADRPAPAAKDIIFSVPSGQTRTIMETGHLYNQQQSDFGGLQAVEVHLRDKTSSEQSSYTIPVQLPGVELPARSLSVQTGLSVQPLVLAQISNTSPYLLLVDFSLDVRLRKQAVYDLSWTQDTYRTTGQIQLPAASARRNVTLIPDLLAVFSNLSASDFLSSAHCSFRPGHDAYLDATLTITMPMNINSSLTHILVSHQQDYIVRNGIISCP